MAKGGKRSRAGTYKSSNGTHRGKWGGGKEHADIYYFDGKGKKAEHHHISAEHWRTNVGGGGGIPCCLVATAYGSSLDLDVQMLRNFRDTKLMTNLFGRIFVKLYKCISPPLAQVIKTSLPLKTVARIILRLPVRLIKLF